MPAKNQTLYPDLIQTQKMIFQPAGLEYGSIIIESESKEYSACQFNVNKKNAIFRSGKITPTKIGQFVTFWKRSAAGPIVPFDISDPVDIFIVSVTSGSNFGQFVFPKSVLIEQNILSKSGVGGKLAFRVYPSWDITDNKQAIKTQKWQLKYFFKVDEQNLNIEKIKELYSSSTL